MIGRTILHYTVLSALGSGAWGRVYLGHDERTQRRVALKFLNADFVASAPARKRLVAEARAASRLSHPGIVTLFALEEDGQDVFLVEEFVEGPTLAQRLEQGPLSAEEGVRLLREVAAALAHAHQRGVYHRDLKPSNILTARDGSYKIADFGIARLEGIASTSGSARLLGTLPYMAPERLGGAPGDGSADVFSLGAVAYEALSGRRAFLADNEAALVFEIMNQQPPPLELRRPTHQPLASLVSHLLEKRPERRPSAEAVLGALDGVATTVEAARPARRGPWIAAGVIVSLVAFLGFVAERLGEAPKTAPPAIAILDFENVADPADPGRLGMIISRLLATSLAQTPGLRVLSRQSILDIRRQFDRSNLPPDRLTFEIARRVHASRIVTGQVLGTQPRIVIAAEVEDVSTGAAVDAAKVEGGLDETIFDVVDSLGTRLREKMNPAEAGFVPLATRTSTSLEAQRAYIEGTLYLSRSDIGAAIGAFETAIREDPRFREAYEQLAIAQWKRASLAPRESDQP